MKLYILSFIISFFISLILVPFVRYLSIISGHYDVPNEIKTHKGNVPLSGGIAVFISFSLTLILFRFFTSFPTGTLREIRYILIGSFLILLIGFIDDIKKPEGIKAEIKFIIEVLLSIFMITRGFSINFIKPEYIGFILTILWIVGVTNAFNIIDVMDGLSSSQIFISSIAFLLITLPMEQIYVNFLSSALAGSILAFIPYNMSKRYKIFLGDSGSLFCGFLLSVISLGGGYSNTNPLGVYAPVLIFSIPVYDTLYVSYMRIKKGISPFHGTKDHFALRLEVMGYERKKIVIIASLISIVMSMFAYLVTRIITFHAIVLYIIALIFFFIVSKKISIVNVD